jgi:tryptophanyl-tRNA synthetase
MPQAFVAPMGARIMGLQNPTEKMSKSDENINDCVYLSDSSDVIIKKFKKAVTDSDNQIKIAEDKPGVSNLLTIYACVTKKSLADCEKEFEGKGYGHLKQTVGETVAETLAPYQKKHAQLMADAKYLDETAAKGAEKAAEIAAKTLAKVKEAIGF